MYFINGTEEYEFNKIEFSLPGVPPFGFSLPSHSNGLMQELETDLFSRLQPPSALLGLLKRDVVYSVK